MLIVWHVGHFRQVYRIGRATLALGQLNVSRVVSHARGVLPTAAHPAIFKEEQN
jgi:hypothetical protein